MMNYVASTSVRRFSIACVYLCLSAPMSFAQVNENEARARATEAARAAWHMSPTQFLDVQRYEVFEREFEESIGTESEALFLYRVSEDGDESKGQTVIYHRSTDGDSTGFIAVTALKGRVYRIKGFGAMDSLSEFNRLFEDSDVKVVTKSRARAIADFYLLINPQNIENIEFGMVRSPLEAKQSIERECHAVGSDFATSDREFLSWWANHKSEILSKNYDEKVTGSSGGFSFRFLTLAFPKGPKCGGSLLELSLEVSSTGTIKPFK